ncbi:dihydroneopterin aldolase [Robiginitalea sp. IMCC44478]|uniref:dihydroneopterin aldolase n=1 Tax=Robiginitalea sp. IMCC44478 TaxID=3459122 RepID=UPI004041984D
MEGLIELKNIRVYAYHGCLEEESLIGSDYRVDLTVGADLARSAKTDSLSDTVDYVLLNKIVVDEMHKRSKLLENVAMRILDRIFEEEPAVGYAEVAVSKINPPLGGDVQQVSVCLSKKR